MHLQSLRTVLLGKCTAAVKAAIQMCRGELSAQEYVRDGNTAQGARIRNPGNSQAFVLEESSIF